MKKKIRNLLFISVFFATFFELHGQKLGEEQLDVISRNILSYHFRYALNYDLNLKSDNVLLGKDYFFNDLWLKEGQNLKLDVLFSELTYPIERLSLYHIKKRGFQMGNDSIRILNQLTSFQADDNYLVAVDSQTQELKFVSGNFFHSSIQDDFYFDLDRPETFIDYLMLRAFNWSVVKIEYKNNKKGKLIFSAYSQYLNGNVLIEVDELDFDQVRVLQLGKKVSY